MRQTKFAGWVTNFGVGKLARDACCTRFAVYKWLRGESIPRTDRLLVITHLAAGELSNADLFEHFVLKRSHDSHRR